MPCFVTSGGNIINFGDIGKGTPLLFIHGWMMSGAVWEYQLTLSESFRVITPDLRGHGYSADAPFSYAACRDDLVELVEYLSLDRAVMIGWSMGAQILLSSFSKLKKRVAAILLVSGTPCFCANGDYQYGVPVAEVRALKVLLRQNLEQTAEDFFNRMFTYQEISLPELPDILRKIKAGLPSKAVAMAALDELIRSDLCNILPDISTPVLLLHGDEDLICPSSASYFMLEKLTKAEIRIFEGSGHAPFLTRAPEFNRVVQDLATENYVRH